MLSTIQAFLSSWYNLPFTFLLAICLLLAVLQWAGLDGDEDSGSDRDGEQDVDSAGSPEPSTGVSQPEFSFLAYLGVGRVPLLVALLLWFGFTGLTGLVINYLFLQISGSYPALAFGAVFLVAVGLGSFISSRLTRAIGPALPPIHTTPAYAIIGRRGQVISPYIDQRYGIVSLHDRAGAPVRVFAVTPQGLPSIRRGEEVICVSYDSQRNLYRVIRAQGSYEAGHPRG